MKRRLFERLLGTIVHVPVITIIWTSYIWYHLWCYGDLSRSVFYGAVSHPLSSAALPLVFTVLSLPISLSIMIAKKRSSFIKENAHEAFSFTLWLIKRYCFMVIVIILGKMIPYYPLVIIANGYGIFISGFCFFQSIFGIVTAWSGNIYRYWFWRFL